MPLQQLPSLIIIGGCVCLTAITWKLADKAYYGRRMPVGGDEYDYMLWQRDEKLLRQERNRIKAEVKRMKKEAKTAKNN